MTIHIKRVYEQASPGDGRRILVDRLWPRGLTKDKARIDVWLKAVAPSTELRQWFGHDPAKWTEFQKRYRLELARNQPAIAALREELGREGGTLLYGAKDEAHNHALVLKAYLEA